MRGWPRVTITVLCLSTLLSACLCRNPTIELPADALEPNDTPAQATIIEPNLPVIAMMNEREAPDVFRFTAVQGETMILAVERLEGSLLDFDVVLEGPDGTGVATDLPAYGQPFPATLEFRASATGTQFLTLRGDYVGPPDALCLRGTLSYRLVLTVVAPKLK